MEASVSCALVSAGATGTVSASTGTSSGIGSGSGSSSKRRVANEEKKFACSYEGCTKRFTRAEHLQRHALNHTAGTSTCPRCSAHFKRPDLLDRHMERHRQKDIEAGGEGRGVLDTRKRSWKAADGTVVERRPHPAGRARVAAVFPTSPVSEGEEHSFESQEHQQQQQSQQQAESQPQPQPQPRPQSQPQHQNQQETQETQNEYIDLQLDDPILTSLLPACQSDPWQLWNEQPFQPDTASSFNMPYTTALDYNWLFNLQNLQQQQQQSLPPAQNLSTQNLSTLSAQNPPNPQPILGFDHPQTPTTFPAESYSASEKWPGSVGSVEGASPDDCRGLNNNHNQTHNQTNPSNNPTHHPMDYEPMMAMAITPDRSSTMSGQGQTQMNHGQSGGGQTQSQSQSLGTHSHIGTPSTTAAADLITPHEVAVLEVERPLSILLRPVRLPRLDAVTLGRLQQTVESAKPMLPEGTIGGDHPFLSLASLQSFLDLFFTRFNAAYPIIHLATFDPSKAEPLLLLSVILLGATYASKEAHKVAVCIHDVIRPSIFAHAGFSARPPLWALQTILLVECFGKSRAGQKQHDMSHLFHGLLINLIRRSDCQSVRPPPPPEDENVHPQTLERAWQKWAEAEQKKRLALNCFMWDTQHAVLFCQSLCMSAFELRLHFPCSQSVWEAPDAAAWAAAWKASPTARQPQPFYLPTLKSYLNPGGGGPPPPPGLNAHARVLVLDGLMSIFWDMQRRDQTSLGAVAGMGPGTTHWKDILSVAYDRWNADFDAYVAAVLQQPWFEQLEEQASEARRRGAENSQEDDDDDDEEGESDGSEDQVNLDVCGSVKAEFKAFVAAAKAVYHSAQCLLRMDFLDIQIYAGARHILGRPVQQGDYLHSAQVVRRWAAAAAAEDERSLVLRGSAYPNQGNRPAGDAVGAAWHAARMLRDVVPEADSEAMASLSHVPWCLYLATLTCWAFVHAYPSRQIEDPHYHNMLMEATMDVDEMVWDSQGEMKALVAAMAENPSAPLRLLHMPGGGNSRRRIVGLVWVMADVLTKVRWGIVHSGVLVLRGLVPARLINQYEADI